MGLRIIDRRRDLTDAERHTGLTAEARHWLMSRGTHDLHSEQAFVEKLTQARSSLVDPQEMLAMAEGVRSRMRAMRSGEPSPHYAIALATLLDLL